MKRFWNICCGLAVAGVLAGVQTAALAGGPGKGPGGRSLGSAGRNFSGLGGFKSGPNFSGGNASRVLPKTTPMQLGTKLGPSLGGSFGGSKGPKLPGSQPLPLVGTKLPTSGGAKTLPSSAKRSLTILPHPHHHGHHNHHDHHHGHHGHHNHHHHSPLPVYCHTWWPTYPSTSSTVVVQEPVVVQVPVPVALPTPAPATSSVASIPAAPTQAPKPAEVKNAETPVAPETLPQLKLGGTYEFPASLGKEQGGVVLKLNGVSLGCLVKKWTPASVTSTLPLLGIESPTKAELAVLLPDGSVAQTYAVEVVPLENEPSALTAAK